LECETISYPRELMMPASLKIPGFERPEGLRLPRRAVVGVVAVIVAVAAGSALHIFGADQRGSDDARPPGTSADWAGSPAGADSADGANELRIYGPKEAPLSSADYTSGFDQNAAGLGPLPASREPLRIAQPRDSRFCPDDLNCTFRPAKAAALPSHRSKLIAVEANAADPVKPAPPPQPSGFAMLTANLRLPIHLPNRWPTPNTLLTPFQSVSNTVAGFVKKL
jgi:hypothetical protein